MADIFLKLMDGKQPVIDGESLDEADPLPHRGEIEIRDWTWKVVNSATWQGTSDDSGADGAADSGGQVISKPKLASITLYKHCDLASVNLMRFCLTGQIIPKALITCRKNFGENKHEYLIVELSNVKIHHVDLKGMEQGEIVNEEVELQFSQFKFHYTQQGNLEFVLGPKGERTTAEAVVAAVAAIFGPTGMRTSSVDWDVEKNKPLD
jgi:type VI protein secretion system component Hcp